MTTRFGASCPQLTLPPVYVLMTSTPDRAVRLPTVLANFQQQTLQPEAVILTVARSYSSARFHNTSYVLPPNWRGLKPKLVVHQLDSDAGPLSKYFGAASSAIRERDQAIAVVADDDMVYGRTFVEDYACAVGALRSGTVFSSAMESIARSI